MEIELRAHEVHALPGGYLDGLSRKTMLGVLQLRTADRREPTLSPGVGGEETAMPPEETRARWESSVRSRDR